MAIDILANQNLPSIYLTYVYIAQSAVAVEYTDCFSAERLDPTHLSWIWH